MKTIVLFRGQAQYDVLGLIIEELAAVYRNQDRAVEVIDLFAPDVNDRFNRTLSQPCEFVFAFNGMGSGLRVGDRSVYDAQRVPYLTFLVDHPMYLLDRLLPGSRFFLATGIDRTHVAFLERWYGERMTVRFLPHAGSRAPGTSTAEGGRDLDVLFGGSYYDPELQRAEWARLSPEPARLVRDLTDALLATPEAPQWDTACAVLRSRGVEPTPSVAAELLKVLPAVDKHVAGRRRLRAMQVLAASGLAVDVYGSHWERAPLKPSGRFRLHPPVEYLAMLALMGRAKVVFNMLPNFPDGSHERVFCALLNGAVPVTTRSRFLAEELIDEQAAIYYSWGREDEIPGRVEGVLADPERQRTVAAAGQATVEALHTWRVRAGQLLALAGEVRARNGER